MGRFFGFLRVFRHDFVVMLYAIRHKGTPKGIKFLLAVAFLYLISPMDLVPDTLPVVGWIDDATLVPAAICGISRLLPRDVREDCEQKADKLGRRLPIMVLVMSVLVLAWIGLLCYGVYRLFS